MRAPEHNDAKRCTAASPGRSKQSAVSSEQPEPAAEPQQPVASSQSQKKKRSQHNRQLNHYFEMAQLCNVQTERPSKKYAGIDPKDHTKRNNQRPDLVLVAHFGNGSVLADVRGLGHCVSQPSSYRLANMLNMLGMLKCPNTDLIIP